MAILINLEGYMQLNNLSRGVLSEEINVSRGVLQTCSPFLRGSRRN